MLDFPAKTISRRTVFLRKIKYLKNLLVKQQKEVEKNLKEVEKDDPATTPALAESSEPGTDSYIADTHTKTLVLEDQLKKTDNSIKKALLKIKNGTYGKCEECGKNIELKRLLVMPIAKYCVSDSKKISK